MPTRVELASIRDVIGTRLVSDGWRQITQEQVNLFAEATSDRQWIHVDPARAERESPYGGTIAHGFLSLSLVPSLFFETLEIVGARTIINYGANKTRFPAPVPVGSRVRGAFEIIAVEEVTGGVQLTFNAVIEIEGSGKPAMAAEILFRCLG